MPGTDEYTCSGWCCVDCLMYLANGEAPGQLEGWTEEQVSAWVENFNTRNAGFNLALGMLSSEHDCTDEDGNTAGDNGGECDCEVNTFSWSSCDTCGSSLGGERNAMSFWRILPPWQCDQHNGRLIGTLDSARSWVSGSSMIYLYSLGVPSGKVREFTADNIVNISRYRERTPCCGAATYANYLLSIAWREVFSRRG